MSFVCGISGEPTEDPVISPISGHIFDRRLISKFVAENGTDPISCSELSENQLISVKTDGTSSVPRNAATTSIPSLLKMLQDEWDTVMLNSFSLRQQLLIARQELSHSLYQHDAACRVIARLSKELTAAREALSTLKPHTTSKFENDDVSIDESEDQQGLSEAILIKLEEKSKSLTADRKQRGKSLPDGLAKQDELTGLKQTSLHTAIHSTGTPGLTSLDICDKLALTGGIDKTAVLYNWEKEQVVQTFKGHSKKINAVVLHPDSKTSITASADSHIRVWTVDESVSKVIIDVHQASVTDISLNATGDYILSASDDSFWAFSDIRYGKSLCKVAAEAGTHIAMHCIEFHPDGLIFGTGTADAVVKIWDLKNQTVAAAFPGHSAAVRSIAFSENGYYLATGSEDGEVKLWDLRKLKNLKTLTNEEKQPINSLSFDMTGTFLGIGGQKVQVLHVKSWNEVATLSDHSGPVTGVRFGENARSLVTCSLDKSLRVFSI
uniref:Pre-mRNA-processing factor 19 n=1 Tax=Caenorhabditis japonica TaxID=281687 RepID=A0A8R1DI76_CAEJA